MLLTRTYELLLYVQSDPSFSTELWSLIAFRIQFMLTGIVFCQRVSLLQNYGLRLTSECIFLSMFLSKSVSFQQNYNPCTVFSHCFLEGLFLKLLSIFSVTKYKGCLAQTLNSSMTDIQFDLEIQTFDPSKCIIDHSNHIVSNLIEDLITQERIYIKNVT